MVAVVWSKRAKTALKKAYEYIQQDSPQNAAKVVEEIIDLTLSLPNHPEKYQPDKYKKDNDGQWRAFEIHHYRISYHIMTNEIRIVRMRHTSQSPRHY